MVKTGPWVQAAQVSPLLCSKAPEPSLWNRGRVDMPISGLFWDHVTPTELRTREQLFHVCSPVAFMQ